MPTAEVNLDDLQQVNTALAASDAEWQAQFAAAVAADARTPETDGVVDTALDTAFAGPPVDDAGADVTTDDTATSTVQEQTQPSPATEVDASDVNADAAGAGSDVGGATDTAPADGSFVVTLADGQQATVTQDQLRSLVELGGWAQGLSEEQRAAIAQVTDGKARAVPTQDYEQFEGWRQSRPKQQDTSWMDDLDPEARAYVSNLQQAAARAAELESRPSPAQSAEAVYELQRQETMFRSSANQWFNDRGLDTDAGGALFEKMLHTGAIEAFMPRFTQHHPVTGQPAGLDVDGLARACLDFTLVQDPELHNRVLNARTAAPATPATPPAVAQKIARASSLATAPSASVSQPPSDPRSWTPQQTTSAIADFLREQTGAG